jgi:hypothetical protein
MPHSTELSLLAVAAILALSIFASLRGGTGAKIPGGNGAVS